MKENNIASELDLQSYCLSEAKIQIPLAAARMIRDCNYDTLSNSKLLVYFRSNSLVSIHDAK